MDQKTTIEMNLAPKFAEGDRVRVVTTDTPFFGWTGSVASRAGKIGTMEQGELYFVQMDANWIAPPLLFREMQLADSL